MTIVAGMALAVSLSLMMTLLDLRPAEAQGNITGLLTAGTYVEDPATAAGSPRIVVIYADGNWTLFTPATTSLMFGTWEERVAAPTDTDTATDTATDAGSVTLDSALVDPAGISLPYTLQLDEMFTSVTVTNITTQVMFEAVRIAIGTETETDTDTDTAPDTATESGNGTETDESGTA